MFLLFLITTKILLIFSSINLFQINTQILLYTRRNRKIPDVISYSNISGTLPLTKFNISAPLKVIIHGFGSSCQRVWPSEMRLALLTVVGTLKRISYMRMTIFLQKKTLLNILKLQILDIFPSLISQCVFQFRLLLKLHWSNLFPALNNTTKVVKYIM